MPPLPSPRPRNAEATRAAMLDAARARFARLGYDGAGLRDIAADAGVDAALVSRYFGSKDELFAEVLACSPGPGPLIGGDREGFGDRVANLLLDEPPSGHKLDNLLIMLRSAGSPRAHDLLQQSHDERFRGPVEEWLGGDDAPVRARLILSILLGFAVTRVLGEENMLKGTARKELRRRLAATLQACVDG